MGQKHMLGQKQILFIKLWVEKIFLSKKEFGSKVFWVKKMGKIVFGSKNDFVSTILLGSTTILAGGGEVT